jgi:hypothetical protein
MIFDSGFSVQALLLFLVAETIALTIILIPFMVLAMILGYAFSSKVGWIFFAASAVSAVCFGFFLTTTFW